MWARAVAMPAPLACAVRAVHSQNRACLEASLRAMRPNVLLAQQLGTQRSVDLIDACRVQPAKAVWIRPLQLLVTRDTIRVDLPCTAKRVLPASTVQGDLHRACHAPRDDSAQGMPPFLQKSANLAPFR